MAESGPNGLRSWLPPDRSNSGQDSANELLLYNSFTDRKEVFTPHQSERGENGKRKILWYSCGPTVYDSAHLGHSRNYMTIDILRRVMEDYFDYDVTFVMNITDVDDKIVLRARRNYLLQQYQKDMSILGKHMTDVPSHIQQAADDATKAVQQSLEKQQQSCDAVRSELKSLQTGPSHEETNGEVQKDQQRREKRVSKKAEEVENALKEEEYKLNRLTQTQQALAKLQKPDSPGNEEVTEFLSKIVAIAGEEIALWQDKLKGASVTDPEIYKRHAERYEAEFWEDMHRLGMRIPEEKNLTRVTEYMTEIIEYIERIMENGFAYTKAAGSSSDNRSVYFDTQSYIESGHSYPKLSPWAGGSTALAAAGETNFVNSEKKSGRDFALWKASKAGEPSWPSPWGNGRPGWHIECSAMASKLLGKKMDIHTGGVDLRFPHHDNELAQAEAHYHPECGCSGQWVNYFLHSGHLNINGLKMSKSLKNFYTIREILDQKFSATQLRLMFAMQPWNKEMNFVFTAKQALQKKESTFKHFFKNVGMLLPKEMPQESANGHARKWSFDAKARAALLDMSHQDLSDPADKDLAAAVQTAAEQVHRSLLDNINTGAAVEALLELVAVTNKYIKQREEIAANAAGPPPNAQLLKKAAEYVEGMLRVMGISTIGLHLTEDLSISSEQLLKIFRQFRDCTSTAPHLQEVCATVDLEQVDLREGQPAGILDALTSFRSRVRTAAKKHKVLHALEECDRMRDSVMVDLGIRMEDKADGSSAWMADEPETLREERREREEKGRQEALTKAKKGVDVKKALLEKVERQAKQPTVQEALQSDYSRFSSEGQDANPTHDKEGNELDKGALKKGKSKADSARKQRAFYEKQVSEKGPLYLEDLRSELSQLEREYRELQRQLQSISLPE